MHNAIVTTLGKNAAGVLLAVAMVAAASGARAQTKEVEVGLIAPMSGPWARQGEVMKMAADLAIDAINQQGGIRSMGGAKLKLSVFDAGDTVADTTPTPIPTAITSLLRRVRAPAQEEGD